MTQRYESTRVVARVVLPRTDAGSVLPLYLDGEDGTDPSGGFDAPGVEVLGRRSVRLDRGRTVSFGSYLNHFPAGYWSTHSAIDHVILCVRTTGEGRVTVHRSDSSGAATVVADESGQSDHRFELPLRKGDVAAYWFDLTATGDNFVLVAADWSVPASQTTSTPGTATAGIATFNRPADCAAQLMALAADEDALEVLDRIVVVDQGTDAVTTQPAFAQAARVLGDRLTLIVQDNLGGSGGFSRAMFETVTRGESAYALLLDDDAISEPESVIRAAAFADAARAAHRSVIVGGGMLHLDDRTRLYAQSEQWDCRIGWVDLSRSEAYDHDFARSSFRGSPYWHRTHRADFNGWWFCLVPVELLRRVGLALPMFLKGDDVEFARRAARAGVETVSLPGVAVWHLGWGGKAPTRTWEAYFLHRNRLIGELLHADRRRPLGIVLHSLLGDLKPLLMLQYSAVRLRAQALDDVFAGPDLLPEWLRNRPAEIQRLRERFPDAVAVDVSRFAAPGDAPGAPRGRLMSAAVLARTWARHLLVPASAPSLRSPQARVGPQDLGWWTFAAIDSALVDAPDGTSTTWYRRSRSMTLSALRGSLRRHLRLWWKWPTLARAYRGAAPDLASMTSWARTFGGDR